MGLGNQDDFIRVNDLGMFEGFDLGTYDNSQSANSYPAALIP